MRLTPWTTWLTASNTDPIYLLLNTLATPTRQTYCLPTIGLNRHFLFTMALHWPI
ncbi:hypothetical protein [Providencia hangzhouensis]|uniref:hypothetical protein n=1 Tax=Providencia hangzhouensis TaxID=3031799 RepID=UPI0034DD79FE